MNTQTGYGLFLRPDPQPCWTVTQVTHILNKQFGLVSASAFPPHVTLVGNLCRHATEVELIAALAPVFEDVRPFPVYNSGISRREPGMYEYVVNLDESGSEPNEPLGQVADAVAQAVAPLSVPVDDYLTAPVAEYEFAAQLGLASHDLTMDNHLSTEVGEFLTGLPSSRPLPSSRAGTRSSNSTPTGAAAGGRT